MGILKMKHSLFLILLLSMLIVPTSTADKVQVNDSWTYTDNFDTNHTETAVSNVQIVSDGEVISAMLVQTTRGYQFPLVLNLAVDTMNIVFDLNAVLTGLYVTQEGIISLYPQGTIDGTITGIGIERSIQWNVSDTLEDTFKMEGGDPSLSLISTTSSIYTIVAQFGLEEGIDVHYRQSFIMSSNNNPADIVKDFTVTPTEVDVLFKYSISVGIDYALYIRYNNLGGVVTTTVYEGIPSGVPTLQLNAVSVSQSELPPAQLYTYETGIDQPTYIKQTEPAETSVLSLLQTDREVEYFLQRDTQTTSSGLTSNSSGSSSSESSRFPLLIFPVIIAFIIIVKTHRALRKNY